MRHSQLTVGQANRPAVIRTVHFNNSEYAVQDRELLVEYPQLRNIRKNIAMATASVVRLCTSYESEVL